MPSVSVASPAALVFYLFVGAFMGLLSVGVTKAVYAIEDWFERLPIHWVWWPAWSGLVVGAVGWYEPRTLGVGYENISALVNGHFVLAAALGLGVAKFLSWSIALGSGTSGGTLAPLLTIGGAAGAVLGLAAMRYFPRLRLSVGVAALVGMTALFAGASRAMLASVVFGLETTHQPEVLAPLLAGCAVAMLVSQLLMRHSIMTEKIVRRGGRVLHHYDADPFHHIAVGKVMEVHPLTIDEATTVEAPAERVSSRDLRIDTQSTYFVVTGVGQLTGVVSRGDLLTALECGDPAASVLTVAATEIIATHPDETLQEAIEKMLKFDIGRLPVVARHDPRQLLGVLTRRAVLMARHEQINHETEVQAGWIRSRARV